MQEILAGFRSTWAQKLNDSNDPEASEVSKVEDTAEATERSKEPKSRWSTPSRSRSRERRSSSWWRLCWLISIWMLGNVDDRVFAPKRHQCYRTANNGERFAKELWRGSFLEPLFMAQPSHIQKRLLVDRKMSRTQYTSYCVSCYISMWYLRILEHWNLTFWPMGLFYLLLYNYMILHCLFWYVEMLIGAVCILSFVEFCLLKVYISDISAERWHEMA